MNPQKLALILITSALLAANSYASTTQEHVDESAVSSEQRETVGLMSHDSEVTTDTTQPASPDLATAPNPAEPATQPEKNPVCSGVANCTGQVVKGVVGGIAAAALAILYFGLMTGLIFVL
jgi:hypothetical protein